MSKMYVHCKYDSIVFICKESIKIFIDFNFPSPHYQKISIESMAENNNHCLHFSSFILCIINMDNLPNISSFGGNRNYFLNIKQ